MCQLILTISNRAFAGTAKPEVPIGQKVALYVNPERPDEFYCPDEKKVPVPKVFAGVRKYCCDSWSSSLH